MGAGPDRPGHGDDRLPRDLRAAGNSAVHLFPVLAMKEPSFEFSNAVRLSGRQWIFVGLLTLAMVIVLPRAWTKAEKFEFESDYRVPYELSTDYWHYARFARIAAENSDILAL